MLTIFFWMVRPPPPSKKVDNSSFKPVVLVIDGVAKILYLKLSTCSAVLLFTSRVGAVGQSPLKQPEFLLF